MPSSWSNPATSSSLRRNTSNIIMRAILAGCRRICIMAFLGGASARLPAVAALTQGPIKVGRENCGRGDLIPSPS